MNKKVMLGMSGGVDSSVAAARLIEAGYEVIGVTLRLLEGEAAGGALEDAAAVAERLGIRHFIIDKRLEFNREVKDHFLLEYKSCRTPNPCIVCNKKIKWDSLLALADEQGADYVATGHYARIVRTASDRFAIKTGADSLKDQSYFLYTLSQEELKRTIFPLGDLTKSDVREIAAELGLSVSEKKDSQDICFILDGDFAGYISALVPDAEMPGGFFTDTKGNVLGEHKGLFRYTIGQRKNLGIALGKRAYVKGLNRKDNSVILCDDKELFSDALFAGEVNLMSEKELDPEKEYGAKIRYARNTTPCTVSFDGERLKVIFKKPVRAVTPGQAVVIYDGDLVAAGGVITGEAQ